MLQSISIFRANRRKLAELYGENTLDFTRAVFLSTLGRSFAAMLVAVHLVVMFPGTSFLDTGVKLILVPFIAVLVALLYLSAWMVENGRHVGARNLTNFTMAASCILSVVFCGGFTGSHATPFLLAPLVVAFCISPRREAAIVGTTTFMLPLLIDIAAMAGGWDIPDYTSRASPEANAVFLMGTLFATMFIALSYLQKTNDRLHAALEAEKRTFEYWATRDPLTDLGNRRHFDNQLEEAHRRAAAGNSRFAILYLDLNAFKPINDTFGHETGDEVLKVVSQRLRNTLRNRDCLARLGGDEFGVLLSGTSADADIDVLTGRVREAVRKPVVINGTEHRLSTSIGKAVFPDDGASVSDLMRTADLAMYTDKVTGKLNERMRGAVSNPEDAATAAA